MTDPVNPVETSVLGAILLEPKAYDEAMASGLEPEDFVLDSHRRIFRAMRGIAESAAPIDTITLVNYLERHKELYAVGDVGYISGLLDGVPDRPSIKSYIRILRERSARRKLIFACEQAAQQMRQEMHAADGIEYLTDQMLQVQTGSEDAPACKVMEFTESTYSEWVRLSQRDSELAGLSTGVQALDATTTGIRTGELWVFAGRTGDGKTQLSLQSIAANCREGNAAAIFSIEMSKEAILQRLWAGEGQVDFKHVRFPRYLSADVKQKVKTAMLEVAEWPLFVVEESGIQLSKLIAKARLLIRREKVKLIVVDYVQLVSTHGRDEREKLTKVSHGLMSLAKETGVPVIAISQLSRPRDGNENQRPAIFNLKECLAENSLVTMDDGEQRQISDVGVGERVLAWDKLNGVFRSSEVLHSWNKGSAPTLTLKTCANREITGTASHPVLTPTGWTSLGDLRRGDLIATPRNNNDGKENLPREASEVLLRFKEMSGKTVKQIGYNANQKKRMPRRYALKLAEQFHLPELRWWAENELHWDEVKVIEKSIDQDVWDIEVEGHHNFVANGLVVHNSGSLENDAHVVVMIYRPVDDRKMKTGEDELIVGKQRSGVTSIEKVYFAPWLRFQERA